MSSTILPILFLCAAFLVGCPAGGSGASDDHSDHEHGEDDHSGHEHGEDDHDHAGHGHAEEGSR